MCDYKHCIYSITETDNHHEIFLFCSFHNCLPENCPQECFMEEEEDFCAVCHHVIYPVNDCKCSRAHLDDIPF